MVLFRTRHSTYAIDTTRRLLLQLPGGSELGLTAGVWHPVSYEQDPRLGERFFALVHPLGGEARTFRTSVVTWTAPEPPATSQLPEPAAVHTG